MYYAKMSPVTDSHLLFVLYDKVNKERILISRSGKHMTIPNSAFVRNYEHVGFVEVTKEEYDFIKENF